MISIPEKNLCRVLGFDASAAQPRPMINKPLPLNRGSNRDSYILALKRRGFINHGLTLGF